MWVWSFGAGGNDPAPYYPGSANVDWVAFDAYDTTGSPDVSATLSTPYSQAVGFGKPILVAETGASVLIQKPYLDSVVPALQSKFQAIRGFMYYDATTPNGSWTLDPVNGLPAFSTMANDPYMLGFGSE